MPVASHPFLSSPELTARSGAAPGRPRLRRIPTALWILGVLLLGFQGVSAELAHVTGESASGHAATATALAVLAAATFSRAIEAAFYSGVWRLRQQRVGFAWMFCSVVSLSLLDQLGGSLARLANENNAAWLAPLTGFRVISDLLAEESGVRLAFGGIGALALLRVVGTAYAQRQEGVPWRGALALTGAVWVAGRLALWWTADLLRGLSPLP